MGTVNPRTGKTYKVRQQRKLGVQVDGLVYAAVGMTESALKYMARSCKALGIGLDVLTYTPKGKGGKYGTRLVGSV